MWGGQGVNNENITNGPKNCRLRPPLKQSLFPVNRPGENICADYGLFFPFFPLISVIFLQKKKKRKEKKLRLREWP